MSVEQEEQESLRLRRFRDDRGAKRIQLPGLLRVSVWWYGGRTEIQALGESENHVVEG